jgi:penicillin-binding protein 1A
MSATVAPDIPPSPDPAERRPASKPRLKRLRFVAIVFSVLLLGLVSFVFGIFISVASDLPSLTRFSQLKDAQSSVLLDDLGHPIGVLSQQNRVIVRPEQIPPIVKEAVISIEDKRFRSNGGIDIRGIARAFIADIRHKGNIQGASTIEQQFIKNALQAQSHRTIFEKLRETALAYQLSHKWSKEKIITAYLNTIYFGNGAYGIEAAAQTYFGHDVNHIGCGMPGKPLCVQQLQPWEAALLAGVIQSPTAYDPANHPLAARVRRDLVLRQMFEQGYLTRPVYEESVKQAIPAPKQVQAPQEQTVEGVDAGYFTSWVQQQIIERYGAPRAFDGGLKIKTTLDLGLQRAAEQAVNAYLANPSGPTASLVAIENSTGEVRAMVGGRSYSESPFNLATEGERQPGSSFKAFDLAAALEDGISPGSVWTSKQKEFIVPGTSGKERFIVHNDEGAYSGSNTLTGATAFSDNSIYAEVGLKVGTRRIALPQDGHHDATVDEPRDDDRRPDSRRHAARHGPRLRDDRPRRPARHRQHGADRRPRRHPGSRIAWTPAAGRVQARPQPRRDTGGATDERCPDRDVDARDGPAVRHRARRRARPVRRRQDGHDVQLRRRLVRRLGLQVHGRRVGRLPRQADPDDDGLQRHARARRDVPGAHMARLHDGRTRDRQSPWRTRGDAHGS